MPFACRVFLLLQCFSGKADFGRRHLLYKGQKVVGIIAELNPFHDGHRHIIEAAKKECGAAYVIIAMSGYFVQRGEPAVYSKYERAEAAVRNGADLVLQIPEMFSAAAAEDFAGAGISLLRRTGIVDTLVFGSESCDGNLLREACSFLTAPAPAFDDKIREYLKAGRTYPEARMLAAEASGISLSLAPNDVLGLEYLMAMRKQSADFDFHLIRRDPGFRSAHSIRADLKAAGEIRGGLRPVFPDSLSDMLSYRLLQLDHAGVPLTEFMDVSADLSSRISRCMQEPLCFTERAAFVKTRNYTYSRISRAFIHILLDIHTETYQRIRKENYGRYLRVLAVREDRKDMLGALQAAVIVSPRRGLETVQSAEQEALLQTDLFAAFLYRQMSHSSENEFTGKLRAIMV